MKLVKRNIISDPRKFCVNKTYLMFIIGALLAFPIPIIDDLIYPGDFYKTPNYLIAVQTGTSAWLFSYLIILAVTIPIRLISSLNTKLSRNQLLALNFLSGQSFGFVVIRLMTFSF